MDFDDLDRLEAVASAAGKESLAEALELAPAAAQGFRGLAAAGGADWVLVRPVNGLCNRLSAIVAAALLAKDLGRRLAVDWRCSPVCNCPWERLALPVEGLHLVTQRLLEQEPALVAGLKLLEHLHPSVDQDSTCQLARSAFVHVNLPMCGAACWLDHSDARVLPSGRLMGTPAGELPLALQMPCVTVLAYSEFYPTSAADRARAAVERSALLSDLRPAPAVQQRTPKLPPGTVGVHVRRSDHATARLRSPDEAFVRAMDGLRAGGLSGFSGFFLATDDQNVEASFKSRYRGSLQTLRKRTLDRGAPEGIEDAFADLLALAQCGRILGSCASTFSEVAALFRRARLDIAGTSGAANSDGSAAAAERDADSFAMNC